VCSSDLALHADYTLVTTSHPAQPGETIAVYLTGLGAVTPTVTDGALGPTNPLSNANLWTSGNMVVYFNDYTSFASKQATIGFAGLAPGLLGYQLNVTIPTGIATAKNSLIYMEILTDTADVNQVQVPVGTYSATSAARPAGLTESARRPRREARTTRSRTTR